MLSEIKLVSVVDEKPQPKYYVYYDEWDGNISDITNKPINSPNLHIVTEDAVAEKCMMGILNPSKYVVIDLPNGPTLVSKKDMVRIRKAEETLSKVPQVSFTVDSDINVIFYLNDYIMEVNLNQDTLYKLTGRRFNANLTTTSTGISSDLDLYIIKHNDPGYLVEAIRIDPIELIKKGYLIFDLSHLKTKIGLANLDVLTRRVFKTYGLKFKNNYVNVDYHRRKSAKRIHTKIAPITEEWTTFSVSASTEGWIIKSNFMNPVEQKIYKDIQIYLTGKDPHVVYDKIVIPYKKIGNNQEFLVKTKVNPNDCKLLMGEEGKNLTFKFEEIKYVKPGKY